jgi:hypothetical protein
MLLLGATFGGDAAALLRIGERETEKERERNREKHANHN